MSGYFVFRNRIKIEGVTPANFGGEMADYILPERPICNLKVASSIPGHHNSHSLASVVDTQLRASVGSVSQGCKSCHFRRPGQV